jgi:anti-anti-sigma factor
VTDPDEARAVAAGAPQPGPGPGALVLVLAGRIDHENVPALVEGVCGVLDSSGAEQVICDVTAVSAPDAVAVDALARLQLAVRRRGSQVWLRTGDGPVADLLMLAGLHEIVRVWKGDALPG